MAIYHFTAKIISRSKGQSSVACSAYRSGTKMTDNNLGKIFDYTKKQNIAYSEMIIPKYAPTDFLKRDVLWNSVEKFEIRKDAQLAREFEGALPTELNLDQQIYLCREFGKKLTAEGMVVDFSIHAKPGNPHVHFETTLRNFNEDGSWGLKNTNWNKKDFLKMLRFEWAESINKFLRENGIEDKVSHLSNEKRGLDAIPTIHEGHVARRIARQGGKSERVEHNRRVKYWNLRHSKKKDEVEESAKKVISIADELGKEAERVAQHLSRISASALNNPSAKTIDAIGKLFILAQAGNAEARRVLGFHAQRAGKENWQKDWFWMSELDKDAARNRLGEDSY